MSDRLNAAQWSRYWEKGTITTFHGRFGENYDGPVRDFWHGVFAALPARASIVDLATGNGAVALLAAQYGHRTGKTFDIVGIDSADIDPARRFAGKAYARHLRRIRFLANRPVEATALPDRGQDLATSQFGIEYADAVPTAAEIARTLKPRAATLAALALAPGDELIVVDAGSTDGTPDIAWRFTSRFYRGPRGRSRQMNRGARYAQGDILLFLHADTLLPADGLDAVRQPRSFQSSIQCTMPFFT